MHRAHLHTRALLRVVCLCTPLAHTLADHHWVQFSLDYLLLSALDNFSSLSAISQTECEDDR